MLSIRIAVVGGSLTECEEITECEKITGLSGLAITVLRVKRMLGITLL